MHGYRGYGWDPFPGPHGFDRDGWIGRSRWMTLHEASRVLKRPSWLLYEVARKNGLLRGCGGSPRVDVSRLRRALSRP